MKSLFKLKVFLFVLVATIVLSSQASDILESWNEGPARNRIISFVESAIDKQSSAYIKPEDRIAVFDNDGTVQPEKPYAFVDMFALVRIRDLALNEPEHLNQKYPGWKSDVLINTIMKTQEDKLPELLDAMKYEDIIRLFNLANTSDSQDDIDCALHKYVYEFPHSRFKAPPAKLVYKPMVELIEYLKQNGFTVYFVSGSTTDYLRQFSENIGISRNNVIGWTFNGEVRKDQNGKIYVYKTGPTVEPISVKEGKVVDIQRIIGKVPVVAAGNSSGDIAMLTYTKQNNINALCLILNHNDKDREYNYDFGDPVRNAARDQDWIVVDMQKDFKKVFYE